MPANNVTKLIIMLRTAIVYLAAFALLLWAGFNVYQRFEIHQNQSNDMPEQADKTNSPQLKTVKDTSTLRSQHLFGKAAVENKVAEVTVAPATRLKLKLIGVIATSEDGVSKIIIQIDNSDVDVYSIGDKLPRSNATIEKIEATQVLLRRNGKLESLAIIRPELNENDMSLLK